MAAPVLTKTPQFRPNVAIAASGTVLTTNKNALLAWLTGLTSTSDWVDATNAPTTPSGASMFVVRYSCNASVAGSAGDLVNRISSASDLTWANAGSAHSWIVLRSTALGTAVELLISFEGTASSGQNLTIYISPASTFSGGTTTARPTAADEFALLANALWGGAGTVDGALKLHTIKSSDGESWIFLVCKGGVTVTFIALQKAVAHDTSWTNPVIGIALGSNAEVLTVSNLTTNANVKAIGASAMSMFFTMPFANGASVISQQTSAASLSGKWNFWGMGLVSFTASNVNTSGAPIDMWWVSTTNPTGSTFPTAGPASQFLQAGCLAFPWCQIAALVS